MCCEERNEIQVRPDSLFVFQLCANWLHLPKTHSPEIPATDHRHPCCTTFCRSGHHQRGKVRHLPPLFLFLNQPFSRVSFASRHQGFDTSLGLPSLLSANTKHSCSEKETKDCFSLSHSVLSHTETKCVSMSGVKPPCGFNLSLTRHLSCQPSPGFPVHSQGSSALRIGPPKTAPPSSVDFTGKGAKRSERAFVCIPFSCVIRLWAEYTVFLQSHTHVSASSGPFAGLVFSLLLELHLWRSRNKHIS